MSSKFIFAFLCFSLTLVNAIDDLRGFSKHSSGWVNDIDSVPVPEVTVGFECYHFNICTFQEIVGRQFNVPNQDPTIYVQCTVMRCPNGLVWDAVSDTCGYPPTGGASEPDSERTEEKIPEASITTQQTAATSQTDIPTLETQTTISAETSTRPTLQQGLKNLQLTTERTQVLIMRNTAEGSYSKFFYNTWYDYQQGFGNLDSLYWIGLDKLYNLSRSGCAVRFDLQAVDGTWYFAQYSTFVVGDSADNYRLNIGGYSGNTTFDAMIPIHNNMEFSTFDHGPKQIDCAGSMLGGWWYNNCCTACLTVSPNDAFAWFKMDDSDWVSLKEVEIRFVC